jgi:hypothetical protein
MIKTLEEKNYRIIQADLDSYQQPEKIGRHIPDIIAKDASGARIIVEVETCQTINLDHTKEQFEDFSKAEGKFFVDVPHSCLEQLKQNARSWGTQVDAWYYMEGV